MERPVANISCLQNVMFNFLKVIPRLEKYTTCSLIQLNPKHFVCTVFLMFIRTVQNFTYMRISCTLFKLLFETALIPKFCFRDYLENIAYVDAEIGKVVNEVDNFFNDDLTTYVFTSDHGMTDWGAHGDGSEHETHVPFIAWGAGIANNVMRQDLNQIDIAVLLTSLIGINVPVNSLVIQK